MKRKKLLIFAVWLLKTNVKRVNPHDLSNELSTLMTTEELADMSATFKEAEILSREREMRCIYE